MRQILFFVFFTGATILGLGLAEVLLLRHLNKVWWEKKAVRILAWSLPVIGLAAFILVGIGEYHRLNWLSMPAAVLAGAALILEVSLMLSLPVSGLIHLLNHCLDKHSPRWLRSASQTALDPGRRLFLRSAAAAVPLTTIGMATFGVGRSFAMADVRRMPLPIGGLPDAFVGLRILHLSDLHLRHYVTVDDLAAVLDEAQSYEPDLVVITGDVADDLSQLPPALEFISELKPPLGAYACLGNHEYFRGLNQVRQVFDRSPVELLINRGIRLTHKGASLFLAGIEDPRYLDGATPEFFNGCLESTFSAEAGEDLRLLLSHRPDVFPHAAAYSIQLTLSGHTHGGQVGMFGRSAFERFFPENYLWGHYESDNLHLYTSSGVGHWFPFRLGCPSEAPVIELVSP